VFIKPLGLTYSWGPSSLQVETKIPQGLRMEG
jgi:hypothetical protein